MTPMNWNRRQVIAAAGAGSLLPASLLADPNEMMTRAIPTSGEALPVIGLGTYSVFDVAGSREEIAARRRIVDLLIGAAGSVIDTSPMYQRSEAVIGEVISAKRDRKKLFLATKVWSDGRDSGANQMARSLELMQTDVVDLMQVHNLRDTDVHMKTIRDWQEQGRIRYNGLTHYRASALDALELAMRKHRPDFIQINYSLGEREAEERILPFAADSGVAVLINRPYQGGALFNAVRDKTLPDWAAEFAASWGQFFLKYIVSHPAVTCAIPATSKPHHMQDNLQAGFGPLPDSAMRQRMQRFLSAV